LATKKSAARGGLLFSTDQSLCVVGTVVNNGAEFLAMMYFIMAATAHAVVW
jgi:hypothetical protein